MLTGKKASDNKELCPFFVANGYCTLGKKCKLFHDRTKYNPKDDKKEPEDEDDEDALTEICFSFDTTGSMYSWLTEVRKSISDIVSELFKKIPNIRISIIAHGDYCDKDMYYVLKYIDFCRDRKKIIKFVNEAGPTGGGDAPECYELVLYKAVNALSWSPESKSRALVVIGDADPHPVSYSMNTLNIDWRKETANLKKMGVAIYSIYCGHSQPKQFYKEISRVTGGRCLKLNECKNISQLFMALCLKSSNNRRLFEEYREQLLRHRQCNDELTNAINSISDMIKSKETDDYYHNDYTTSARKRVTIASSVKRLMADLNEIRREKFLNISIVPQGDDVFVWHLNVKPLQGALSDVYIHVILSFPTKYPSEPPMIRCVTKIKNGIHPNITDNYVCLPLFGTTEASKASKYGSSWSAAYSITSLLVNISSIFTEIRSISKKQIDEMLKCNCRRCGHSNTTPYPPLDSNKLPITLTEYDYNDAEEKKGSKPATKKTKVKANVRGVMIAGNILETLKPGQYWLIKAEQDIKRMDACVSWQFALNWFDRIDEKQTKEETQSGICESDIIFGFMTANNIFFGVNIDGFMVYDNKVSTKRVYDHKIKVNDVLTYILKMDDEKEKDVLFIYCNYKAIGKIHIVPYVFENEFYPMMYLKDTRVQLDLNKNMKLIHKIQDIDTIHFMCNLPQNAPRSMLHDTWQKNDFYKDRRSWNVLLERSLSKDVLLEIFTYLSYTDWIRCNNICVYWRQILNEYNVIDRNEMNCFYTKESIDTNPKCILGVGLNITYSTNNWITSISTEMDFLSLNSYLDYKIKKGIWGEPITHFLPLVINDKHAELSYRCLMKRLYFICHQEAVEWQHVNKMDEEAALLAITASMNQFVVQLMASCTDHKEDDDDDDKKQNDNTQTQIIDAKHASEKALIGYCAFHHLLLYLAEKYPKIKEIASCRIKKFIEDENYRHKLHTPDLGKFLLNLAICDDFTWDDLKEAFIAECNVRNVKWYLQKYPHLEYYDASRCNDSQRIECTLKSTTISRRLVIFQVWFINEIAQRNASYGKSLSDLLQSYHKRWGRPTNIQKLKLMKQIKAILAPNNSYNFKVWLQYFDAVGLRNKFKTKKDILTYLRSNVEKSRTRAYHKTNPKVLNENRLFLIRYKYNQKKDLYQRKYTMKLNKYNIMIHKNPIQFEGIKIEYHPSSVVNGKNHTNGILSDVHWVNIYDESTHRWYIGYILRYDPANEACDVLYVGWNKEFVERNVSLNGGRIAPMNTVPLSVNDKGFKQGFIKADDAVNNVANQCVEEYEKKLDLEEKIKNEKAEKIAFYHREFFRAVTDNNIKRVKKFLNMEIEEEKEPNDTDNDDDDDDKKEERQKTPIKTKRRRGRRSGKKKKKPAADYAFVHKSSEKKKKKRATEYDFMVSNKSKHKSKKRNKNPINITTQTSFTVGITPKPPKITEPKPPKVDKREKNKERLFWENYNISIDVHMTDAFGRNPLFLCCYMGHIEMTKILLEHGFSAHIEDINGETALDQIVYGKKQKYHDKESMDVYNMVSQAIQDKKHVNGHYHDKNHNHKQHKYYVYIGGLGDVMLLENEMIDLCEVYNIYPNEVILNKGYCIIGVNDANIMRKIYFMDESFFRCSILNVRLYDGNEYDASNKIAYPSNTLFVSNFDSVPDIHHKLTRIFSKYGKLRRDLVIKQNKDNRNFTFVEYSVVNHAVYAYNDITVNKRQHKFKLNSNEKSNRKINVRFAKDLGGFGGKMGGGRPRNTNYNNRQKNVEQAQTQIKQTLDLSLPMHLACSWNASTECALCFIPSQNVWPQINEIRKKYDPQYLRWMPHMNIFFPFMDMRYFDAIAQFIEKEVIQRTNFKSFDVSLDTFDVFDRIRRRLSAKGDKQMETLFLRPNNKAQHQMRLLYDYLKQLWPSFAKQVYQPHCTVGKFTVSELEFYRMQFQSRWSSVSWKCDAIYLIAREGDKPFTVRNKIPFC